MKKIFFSILALLVLFPYSAFAQNTLGTKIASVNLQQAHVEQSGNAYTVSFTITNGSGIQTGLRYSVQLLQQKATKQYLVDEKVYDDAITLRENASVAKQVQYVPPSSISGSYQVVVAVYNNSGFPFAVTMAGSITLTGSKGLIVYPDTCTVQSGPTKNDISKSVALFPNTKLTVQCSVKNNSTSALTAQPALETKIGSLFGTEAQVNSAALAPITFSPGEQKTVSIVIPKATAPQSYVAKLLVDEHQTGLNPIFIHYTIYGETATIQNISFDKDSYSAKDTANLTLLWTGSVVKPQLNLSVTNAFGAQCAAAVEQTLVTKPIVQIPVAMTGACKNPKITAVLKDANGVVLDQKEFSIQSAQTTTHQKQWMLLVLLAVIILGGVTLYMKRKKQLITTPLALLAIGITLSFFMPNTANADVYYSGPNGEIISLVNMPKGTTYPVGAPIDVTAQIYNYGSTTTYPVSLAVTNNNGTPVTLISGVTLAPGQNTAVYSYTFTNPNGAPNVIGTYPMKFTSGVDVSTSAVLGGGSNGPTSGPVQGGTLDTNVWCDASITQPVSTAVDINFQYQTQNSTTQWEWCSVSIPAGQTNGTNYPGKEYFGPSGTSVQVTDFCFDATTSGVPNGPNSGARSC